MRIIIDSLTFHYDELEFYVLSNVALEKQFFGGGGSSLTTVALSGQQRLLLQCKYSHKVHRTFLYSVYLKQP